MEEGLSETVIALPGGRWSECSPWPSQDSGENLVPKEKKIVSFGYWTLMMEMWFQFVPTIVVFPDLYSTLIFFLTTPPCPTFLILSISERETRYESYKLKY